MENAARNCGKRQAVVELVARTSRERALVLVVEDVHWADRVTLDHLAALTTAVAGCPVVLVMTSRIEGDPLDDARRLHIADIPLTTVALDRESTRLHSSH